MRPAANFGRLSERSLHLLDQAIALKKKDYYILHTHLMDLRQNNYDEYRLFKRLLREENHQAVDAYDKIVDLHTNNVRRKDAQEHQERVKKIQEEFSRQWSIERVVEEVMKLNPYLCGLILREGKYYREVNDLKECIELSLEMASSGYSYDIVMPIWLKRLRSETKRRKNITYASEAAQVSFTLCQSKEKRENIISKKRAVLEEERSKILEEGYILI